MGSRSIIESYVSEGNTDAAYLQAVEAGDMEACQRMVDAAARAAGLETAFRSGSPELSEDGLLWTASDQDYAEVYGSEPAKYFVNPGKVLDLTQWKDDDEVSHSEFIAALQNAGVKTSSLRRNSGEPLQQISQRQESKGTLAAAVRDAGYDSIRINEYNEGRGRDTTLALLSNVQIKSADPVTRDEAGNVIPLSQRFNPASDDIRESVAVDLFERNDLQRVDALEAEAQRVVDAWLSKLKAGMAALFSVRKAGDLKTYDWNETLYGLNTLDFGNLHFVFRSSGGTSGEFKLKGRDTYAAYRGTDVIDINCEVFGLLYKINERARSYLYTKQRKKCREEAYALLAEIERSLQTNDRLLGMPVIDLLVHELTHRDDHAHKDLTGVMRKGDVELSKKGFPTRAEINTQYMSTDHEYNAYCTHAISGARRRFSSTPPENFSDYADVFMAHFGKAHFSLMSVAHRRKVMARAYDAFVKLWPHLATPGRVGSTAA